MTKHKPVRKLLMLLLSFLMVFGMINFMPGPQTPVANAADSDWPASSMVAYTMPFRPIDGLNTTQNPPDFSWPFIVGADSYKLQVSSDANFTTVEKEVTLGKNLYNFPSTFAAGTWYWRVSYLKAGTWSNWSTVRRFRIEQNSVPFIMPTIDEMKASVGSAHPRIWTNPATLDQFRSLATTTGAARYQSALSGAITALNRVNPWTEPVYRTNLPLAQAISQLKSDTDPILADMMNTAFIYLITGEDVYGAKAKELLLFVSSWNPDGETSFDHNDQVHRAIAYKSAEVYDWIYDLLSDDDKEAVQAMVISRTETMFQKYLVNKPTYQYPYDSHGWTILGYIGIIATAMLNDIDEATTWFNESIPVYSNLFTLWGGENGSWYSSTGYWQWASLADKELMDILYSSGAINLYKKAFSRNEGLFPLYSWPHGSPKGVFGDASEYAPNGSSVSVLNRLSQIHQDPRLKWESEAISQAPNAGLQDYFYGDTSLGTMPPLDLPTSRWFEDTGLVTMHSDLIDRDRISFYFKSSPYGSIIHAHADQNAFIINAYGKSLAPETGFYEYYNSPHHAGFTRQTFAANAITFDGKRGQPIENTAADGKILGFVSNPAFDATSGDATAAYMGALTKAVRHVLYIRPDMFVVIDDLATNKTGGSKFEWNLHAEHSLAIDDDGQGATITEGKAKLNVQFYTADPLTHNYTTKYLNANGIEVPPDPLSSFAGKHEVHAQFITPATNATKIVTTMEVYQNGETAHDVTSVINDNYTKLTFVDGTVVYVRMKDTGLIDTGDNIKFDGAAIAIKGDSIMLVNGTKLMKNGETLIDSNKLVTVAYGGERLSVSSQTNADITLYAPDVARLRDYDSGNDIPNNGTPEEDVNLRGLHWTKADNYLTLNVDSGQKAFKLNNAPIPTPQASVVLQTEIDGVAHAITLQSWTDINGETVSWGKLVNPAGFYNVINAPAGFSFVKYGHANATVLDPNTPIIIRGALSELKLETLSTGAPTPSVVKQYPDDDKDKMSMVWKEAEDITSWNGGKEPRSYSTRPFLSGGEGIGGWDMPGVSMTWTLDVPKAGKYDVYMKYVAGWDVTSEEDINGDSIRYLQVGDEMTYIKAPKTIDFGSVNENWRGLRMQTGVQLPAGPVDITMWHQLGGMNLDWIALIEVKADELRPTTPTLSLGAQTKGSVDLSWTASTDPAITGVTTGMKDYVIYANGVEKAVIPAGTTSATVTGLTIGETYDFTVKARDVNDNYSNPSNSVTASITEMAKPVWSDSASIKLFQVYPNAARLSWDSAAASEGGVTYTLFKKVGAAYEPVTTTTQTSFDITLLQPNTSYTFKVKAANDDGTFAPGEAAISFKTPAVDANDATFYESFDDWPLGDYAGTGAGSTWEVNTSTQAGKDPTLVQVVDLGSGNKGLKLTDNYTDGPYVQSPQLTRRLSGPKLVGGKVVLETKVQFKKLDPAINVDQYELNMYGYNGTSAGVFLGKFGISDDGAIYYGTTASGVTRITSSGVYKVPDEEWVNLRADLDLDAKTYNLTVQADSLKDYPGTLAALNKGTGTLLVTAIPFADNMINRFDSILMRTQYGKGSYTFDYLTINRPQARDQVVLAATPSVGSQQEFPVTVAVNPTGSNDLYQEVELHYDTNLFTYLRAESARAGTTLGTITNDAASGTLRIKSTNDAAISGLTDVLKVIFQAKNGGTDGEIAVTEARIGASDAGAVQASGLPLKTIQVQAPPAWDAAAELKSVHAFPDAVRLQWDAATAASTAITSYEVYQVEGALITKVATVNGDVTNADITLLQPGATYTYKVEARDGNQSETIDGPELTVTLPTTSVSFYDSFDSWTAGEVENGNGWTFDKTGGSSVQVVDIPGSGKGLQAVDNYYDESSTPLMYALSPILKRSIAAPYLDGKVTVETKVKFTRLDHDVNPSAFEVSGGGKSIALFAYSDDGALGYRTPSGFVRITPSQYAQPADEWVTLRFDLDFGNKTYDLTIQAPSLKTYNGTPDAAGEFVRKTGIYSVYGSPFLNSVDRLDAVTFRTQLYTGIHTLDYVTAYQTASKPATPVLQLNSRTATSVNLSWSSAAAGSTALKEYHVFANDVQKAVVPAGTMTANITGLTSGEYYEFTVVAVDANDNSSDKSNAIPLTMGELAAPVWGGSAAVKLNQIFTHTARLSWTGATVAEGKIAYTVYREEGASFVPVATVQGTSYDATLLQPGQTYTYKVMAANESGTFADGGPVITFTTPTPVADDMTFFESFDDWTLGEFSGAPSWTIDKSGGTSIQVVDLGDSNKGLKLIDNKHVDDNDWTQSPTVQKSIADPFLTGGKVTVETKIQFTKLDHAVDTYDLDLYGNSKLLSRFSIYGDGALAFKKDGTTSIRITPYDTYAQPDGEWMTLRFDLDFVTKKYDLTIQANSLKNYNGTIAQGALDRSTGTILLTDLDFLDSSIDRIESMTFKPQYGTGAYTFDYLTFYRPAVAPVPNSTIAPATATFDKSVTSAVYDDVSVAMTLNGNTLSSIKNGAAALVEGTDYTAAGNTVTIKKEYLAQQPVGTTNLTFTFSAGATQTLAIAVSDTTAPDNTQTIYTTQTGSEGNDGVSYEFGTKFKASVAGTITKVRIYTGVSEGGDHTVRIWDVSAGTVVAGPYTWNITAGTAGWKEFTLSTPLSITAYKDYIVAVSTSSDHYYYKAAGQFDPPFNNGNLITNYGSGLYNTTLGQMPNTAYANNGYFRDIVFTPSASQNSVISPTAGSFDKNALAGADVATTMTLNGNTLVSIKNGAAALVAGTDYTAAGNTVTIKKEYLAQQPVGTTNLTFAFSAGATQTLAIAVSDTTVPPPTGDNVMSLTPDSTTKTADEDFQLNIDAASLTDPFTIMDLTLSYDPSRLSFATIGDPGEEELDASAVAQLPTGWSLVSSAVIPELGKIRLFLGASSEANAATASGPLVALKGTVKADAPLGGATVSLDQASGSMAGDSHDWDTSEANATITIAAISKTDLGSKITEAQNAYDNSDEGTEPGEYPASARAALLSAIQNATAVFGNNAATQAQVDAAIDALSAAISTFAASVNPTEPLDLEALNALIDAAQNRLDKATEGTKVGQYAAGAIAALDAAVDAAQNAVHVTQADVDAAKATLQAALDTFASKIVTLIPGATKVTIADLSLLVKFYGVTSSDADWDQVAAADLKGTGKIDIVTLAAVAQLILDDWRQQYQP